LVGWLVACLRAWWLLGLFLVCLLGWLVGWLVDWFHLHPRQSRQPSNQAIDRRITVVREGLMEVKRVGWLVGWLDGWLVCCLVGWPWLAAWFAAWLVVCFVAWGGCLIDCLLGWSKCQKHTVAEGPRKERGSTAEANNFHTTSVNIIFANPHMRLLGSCKQRTLNNKQATQHRNAALLCPAQLGRSRMISRRRMQCMQCYCDASQGPPSPLLVESGRRLYMSCRHVICDN